MPETAVAHHIQNTAPLGVVVVLFIALTGLNAGSYLSSLVFTWVGRSEYLPLAKFSALMVMILWAAACLLLLFDTGHALRFWHVLVFFDPRSPASWGSLILTVYPFPASIYLWCLFQNDLRRARFWGSLGFPVVIGSHAFVGFILSYSKAHILWTTALMPLFFLVTAALSGLALVVIFDTFRYYFVLRGSPRAQEQERRIFSYLGEALYILLFLELSLILYYLLQLGLTPKLFHHALHLFGAGRVSQLDFVLPVVLGLILPLGLLLAPRNSQKPWGPFVASTLILLGVWAIESLVITAAQSLPPL